ncbi:hypothetical protein K4K60_003396 [Colletotrichum sp. SAR11_57]|nr:hypothetical protein K4K60_003396 [Colletotrichum sp. SAR11_57]
MKTSQILAVLGFSAFAMAQSSSYTLAPSPTESYGCESHSDHVNLSLPTISYDLKLTFGHCEGPAEAASTSAGNATVTTTTAATTGTGAASTSASGAAATSTDVPAGAARVGFGAAAIAAALMAI